MNKVFFDCAKCVGLLLPNLIKTECFALKGGTAINFFYRQLPRLSIDIDLAYLPLRDRASSLREIEEGLIALGGLAQETLPGARIVFTRLTETQTIYKLIVCFQDANIKIEPNLVVRGHLFPTEISSMGKECETILGVSGQSRLLAFPEVYAGKLCAALDRQHPRDLFDMKVLLENEGLTDDMRRAFVVYLACSDRPFHELLQPTPMAIDEVFSLQFEGMSRNAVSIKELIDARSKFFSNIVGSLKDNEKEFLVSMMALQPRWDVFPEFPHLRDLPAIRWKLLNIDKMNSIKRKEHTDSLKRVLSLVNVKQNTRKQNDGLDIER